MTERKLGTSLYRLRATKSYAQKIAEVAANMELVWQLSVSKVVEDDFAENFIKGSIDEMDTLLDEIKGYYKWREDMEGK